MSRTVLIGLALGGLRALLPRAAAADAPAERAELENGRAKDQFAKGEFRFALELFEKSYSINPLPKYMCNMGQSRLKLAEISPDIARRREFLVKARANVESCMARTRKDDQMDPVGRERQGLWAKRLREKILAALKRLDEAEQKPKPALAPATEVPSPAKAPPSYW